MRGNTSTDAEKVLKYGRTKYVNLLFLKLDFQELKFIIALL